MIYELQRASNYKVGCDESYSKTLKKTISFPAPVKSRYNWFDFGENHREENGRLLKEIDKDYFFIEINSMDELIALELKYGELIIGESDCGEAKFKIIIYDDYIE